MLTCCNIKELSAFVFRNTMLLFLKHFKRHCMTEVEFHFQCSVAFILKTAGREGSVQENDGRSSRIAESLYPVAMVNTVELWRQLCSLHLFLFLFKMTNRKTLWLCSCAAITATVTHSLAHHHSSNHSLTRSPVFTQKYAENEQKEKKDSSQLWSGKWVFQQHTLSITIFYSSD